MVQKRKIPEQKVDWEALAKNLQIALEREIDDNERLAQDKDQISLQLVKAIGVIEYLERKHGNPKL
jgi:hypothetical protein